ncbi:hypothetical protein EDD16DRAFT_1577429 [Pisolithus croceorrhizus]|nr:hypothetical protein EDD16DRAFT_1577429 [Pisolithus croceorrhizus]KAI6123060.1 hypothetical protein EV401DRAFT_2069655 [Pisolithus croceorrhizus]KAI6158624.1 hypothetical protein EDD17DRAFT_1763525 [Pisolithus thermaeus]
MFSTTLFSARSATFAVSRIRLCACPSRVFLHNNLARGPQGIQGTLSHPKRPFSLAQVVRQEPKNADLDASEGSLRLPSGSVYIANVPFSVTASQLEEAFSQFGRVRGVILLNTEKGIPRGNGFVEFETAEEATAFVEADQQDPIFLLDRDLFVTHADIKINPTRRPSDTLVAQHFSPGSEDLIRRIFSDYADTLVNVRIPQRREINGCAFIQFKSIKAATDALHALNARMIPETGRLLRLQFSLNRQTRSEPERRSLASRLSQRAGSQSDGTGF